MRRGSLPLDQVLRYAIEIADALHHAHRHGVVHRDLKPSNVMLTRTGAKLLDFGLAQPHATAIVGGPPIAVTPLTPTLTAEGTIVGTLSYMAPEQLHGAAADGRTDIFAWGAVVYEMLTGGPAFAGESQASVIGAVLERDPPAPSTIQPLVSRLLESIVMQCLAKEPDERWQSAGDLRQALKWITEGTAQAAIIPAIGRSPRSSSRARFAWPVATVLGMVAAALVGSVVWRSKTDGTATLPVARFAMPLEAVQDLALAFPFIGLSPDGTQIVYATAEGLYVRRMADLEARLIPGTEPPPQGVTTNPVFSPDGQSIAYYSSSAGYSNGAIKRIAAHGGTALTLVQTDYPPFGISWGAKDIVFSHSFGQRPWGILRVPPDGGPAEPLIPVDDESIQGPQMLPDGHTILFTLASGASADRWDKARIVVQSLTSGARKVLVEGGSDARYLVTGHLVYARGDVLFVVPFDPGRLRIQGTPVAVIDGASRPGIPAVSSGAVHVAITNRSLVYAPQVVGQGQLAQIDHAGHVRPLRFPPGPYEFPRVSPDGARVAVGTTGRGDANIWLGEIAGDTSLHRLTFGGQNRFPTWSADGRRVAFQSDRNGDLGIFSEAADGSGPAERLTTALPGTSHEPESWSPAGDHLLFSVTKGSKVSLWMLSLRDGKAEPFGGVESSLLPNAVFSRDGRWVVYMSREADRFLISVQPFPATGAKYQIAEGGVFPVWSRNGREIVYFHGHGQLSAVDVLRRPGFVVGAPVDLWLQTATKVNMTGAVSHRSLDVTPDGEFVGLVAAPEDQPLVATHLQVVLNWMEGLKR